MDLEFRIKQISDEINKHEYNYLVLGEATISEYELESLKLELRKLESDLRENVPLYELTS